MTDPVLEIVILQHPIVPPAMRGGRTDGAGTTKRDSASTNQGETMKTILRTAVGSHRNVATTSAFAYGVWPDVDFNWYANVGHRHAGLTPLDVQPAPRAGYIWSPAHIETRGEHQNYVASQWVIDDYDAQLAIYNHTVYTVTAQ
jgi:hypothetical protein